MGSFAAPALVEGAPRLPAPYGLFSVLTPRPDEDGRWMNGVEWEALTCGAASGIGDPSCTPGGQGQTQATGLPKLFANGVPLGDATAFSIIGTFKCAPVGFDPAAAHARATQHLLAREEQRVERALFTGDLGNLPKLAGATEVLASADDAVRVIGELEDFIAQTYGSLGVIHASRKAAPTFLNTGVVTTDGTRARTTSGATPVVFGSGYSGARPNGVAAAAGESWVYATPALFGYRSGIFTSSDRPGDLLDKGRNDMFAVAERTYLVGFDECGVGAALLTLGCC